MQITVRVYEAPDAPDKNRFVAFFIQHTTATVAGVAKTSAEILPMSFFAATANEARGNAETWMATERERIAAKQHNRAALAERARKFRKADAVDATAFD